MIIEEVADHTYRMVTPIKGSSLIFSVYLIQKDGGILIEPGPSAAAPLILKGMKQLGMNELSLVVPTHIHMDHGGGTGTLAQMFPESIVIAHPLSVSHIIDPARLVQSTQISYGEDFEKVYGKILPVPESRVRVPENGECVTAGDYKLKIVHAPGHAPHHIAVFDPATACLFCGEALGMETDDPLPAAAAPSFDVNDCLDTMKRLRSLHPQLLCYSHGGVRSDAEKRIGRAIDNTQYYGQMVLKCLQENTEPSEIHQRIEQQSCAQYPPEWEGDMIRVWRMGIVEGYSIYFNSKGMV